MTEQPPVNNPNKQLPLWEAVFGVSPEESQPEEIMNKLCGYYDAVKSIQTTGRMQENHPFRNKYFFSNGIRDWDHYHELKRKATDELTDALSVAQSHVEENLSFLLDLASSHAHQADTKTILNVWESSPEPSHSDVTEGQKNILRGQINIKK